MVEKLIVDEDANATSSQQSIFKIGTKKIIVQGDIMDSGSDINSLQQNFFKILDKSVALPGDGDGTRTLSSAGSNDYFYLAKDQQPTHYTPESDSVIPTPPIPSGDWEDYFERATLGSDWDVLGLNSATIIDNKAVTTSVQNVWNLYETNALKHTLDVPLTGNFVVEAALEWETVANDLAEHLLYLKGTTSFIASGMIDAWAGNSGGYVATIDNTQHFSTGQGTRPAAGSMIIKIERIGTTINFYENGTLRFSGTSSDTINSVFLTNTRYLTYAGKTAKWNYIKITV